MSIIQLVSWIVVFTAVVVAVIFYINANTYRPIAEGHMTLRDYFAAKAMQGLAADPDVTLPISGIAEAAYRMADAMIKARGETE